MMHVGGYFVIKLYENIIMHLLVLRLYSLYDRSMCENICIRNTVIFMGEMVLLVTCLI